MKKILIIILIAISLVPSLSIQNVYAADEDDAPHASFMDVDKYDFCGGKTIDKALIKNIPSIIPKITSGIYNAVMVIVPLILVVMGSIDLLRGAASQNEDEIKKGKTNFIKRLITGIITFLVVIAVKFVVSAASGQFNNSWRIVNCIDCFVNDECSKMSDSSNVNSTQS